MNKETLQRLITPNERPLMVVYAGPNGGGKSRLTQILKHRLPDLQVIDADAIAKSFTDRPKTQADIAAGREAIRQVRSSMEIKQSFSIETTLGGKSVLNQMKQAKAAGFHVQLYYVALKSPELHIARVAQRVAQGGHDISADDIRRRFITSKQNLPEAMRIADRSLLFDNTEVYQQAAEVYRGQVMHQLPENEMPSWVKSVMKDWQQGLQALQKEMTAERDFMYQELMKARSSLYSTQQQLQNYEAVEKLQAEAGQMEQQIKALESRSFLEKLKNPNKEQLHQVEQRYTQVKEKLQQLQKSAPTVAESLVLQKTAEVIGKKIDQIESAMKHHNNALGSINQSVSAQQQKELYQNAAPSQQPQLEM